jgi:endonuclease YncB( thermonuclease family)
MLFRSLILAAALAAPTLAYVQALDSPAYVIDGDTIVVNRTHIRLHGIDAPEADQTCSVGVQTYACGTAATEALRDLLRGQTLSCTGTGLDHYGRTLAACRLPNGTDVGQWMVRNGYAIAYRHFSMDYAPDEDAAKAEHRGIWAGTFTEPSIWRKEHGSGGYILHEHYSSGYAPHEYHSPGYVHMPYFHGGR